MSGHKLWRNNIREHNLELKEFLGGRKGVLEKLVEKGNIEMLIKKVKLIFDNVRNFVLMRFLVLFWK